MNELGGSYGLNEAQARVAINLGYRPGQIGLEALNHINQELQRRGTTMNEPKSTTAVALTPMALVQQALTSGAGVDTLERLMALQERWQANEAKRDYDAAIAKARAEIPPIYKTRSASFGAGKTSYKYEDLADIATAVDPILPKYGLMYRWKTYQSDDGEMLVTCIVSHEHGHREESSLRGNPDTSGSKNAIQAVGSAATYLQRYTLKQALGLAASKDDDAHAVSAQEATIDAVQYRELMNLIEKTGQDERSLMNYLKTDDLNTLTMTQYRVAMDGLGKKLRRIEERKAAEIRPLGLGPSDAHGMGYQAWHANASRLQWPGGWKDKTLINAWEAGWDTARDEALQREAALVEEVNTAEKGDVTIIDGGKGGEGMIEWKDEEPVT